MIYAILKISTRLALKIYCGGMYIQDRKIFRQQGPLLFASNHPNSFLDALVIAAHTRCKTYILVRGDVFKNKWAGACLRYLGCIPIYRGGDGRAMLGQNELSFEACMAIFDQGDHVLIFSEGNCENEWRLRPLGKGTARLALMSWRSETRARSLQVIPTGFTYSHFNGIGKHIITLTGHPFSAPSRLSSEQKNLTAFNRALSGELKSLMLHFSGNQAQIEACGRIIEHVVFPKKGISPGEFEQLQQKLTLEAKKEVTRSQKKYRLSLKAALISAFAAAGWLLHAPLYYPIKTLARAKTKDTVYYDSVLFGALFLLYPLYLVTLAALLLIVTKSIWCGLIVIAAPWLAFLTVKSRLFKRI